MDQECPVVFRKVLVNSSIQARLINIWCNQTAHNCMRPSRFGRFLEIPKVYKNVRKQLNCLDTLRVDAEKNLTRNRRSYKDKGRIRSSRKEKEIQTLKKRNKSQQGVSCHQTALYHSKWIKNLRHKEQKYKRTS